MTAKRYALWKAHGRKCGYCGEFLPFPEMEIDHIIPHSLATKPDLLAITLKEYGLEVGFNLDDYPNWLPVHTSHNKRKGSDVFPAAQGIFYQRTAQRAAELARREENRFNKGLRADRVVATVTSALEQGTITADALMALTIPSQVKASSPWVACFGTNLIMLGEEGSIPEGAPRYLPALCDWLEEDFGVRHRGVFGREIAYTEASSRTGETLSVRFLIETAEELDLLFRLEDNVWEELEVRSFSDIYDGD